jgi:hypothetical protein
MFVLACTKKMFCCVAFFRAIFLQYVRASAADVYENSRVSSALPPGWSVRRSAGFPACLLATLV